MYSIPYILLGAIYILLSVIYYKGKSEKAKLKIRIFSVFLFVFFFGFRGFVGTDWYLYYDYYYYFLNDSNHRDVEPGFAFLARFIRYLGCNYHLFVLIITIIQGILLDNFLKKYSTNIPLSYAVLIAVFPLLIIDLLRNFLSILIFLQSIRYIVERKLFYFLLIVFIALLFHSTAVLLLPFYFLSKRVIGKKTILLLFGIGLIFYILGIDFIKPLLVLFGNFLGGRYQLLVDIYLESDIFGNSYGLRFGIIEKILFFFLVFYKYNRIIQMGKDNRAIIFFINIFFLYILANLFFSTVNIMIERFAVLLFFSYLIVIPLLHTIYRIRYNKIIVFIYIYILLLVKISVSMNQPIYMYENILYNDSGHDNRARYLKEYYNIPF